MRIYRVDFLWERTRPGRTGSQFSSTGRRYDHDDVDLEKFFDRVNQDILMGLVSRIERRLGQIPNIGYLQIWLQRITVKFDREHPYEEKLCHLVQGVSSNGDIWDLSWLRRNLGEEIDQIGIIDEDQIEKLSPYVDRGEVELFRSHY